MKLCTEVKLYGLFCKNPTGDSNIFALLQWSRNKFWPTNFTLSRTAQELKWHHHFSNLQQINKGSLSPVFFSQTNQPYNTTLVQTLSAAVKPAFQQQTFFYSCSFINTLYWQMYQYMAFCIAYWFNIKQFNRKEINKKPWITASMKQLIDKCTGQ